MSRSKKLLNNSIILLVGNILTKGLNFFMAPLFTRWLSIEDYGMFDLLATYSTLLIPILALGTHHAIFRFLLDDKTDEEKTVINTSIIITNIIGIMAYLIFVLLLSLIFDSLTNYVIQLTILLITQTFQNYMCMFARGIKKLKLYVISNTICTISIFIFVFVFVKLFNLDLNGIIYGYSLGYFISGMFTVFSTRSLKFINFKKISKKKIKEILSFSIPMVTYSISWWIVNISDRVIVNAVLGVAANAIIAVAHKIPNLCNTVYDIFQTAWMENATESIKDKDWDDYFNKMFNTMGQFCITISIIIVTTNFFLFDILFTNDYNIGKYLTPLFALSIIFSALSQTIGAVFIAQYDSKKQSKTMMQAGVVNIIIHLLLIKYIGIFASVVSTIIAYIYLFVTRYIKVKENYKISINKKTIILFCFLILCIILFYLNLNLINYIMLFFSIIFCLILNKDMIKLIVKKILKN